jgi:hypothetical protein
MTPKQWENQIMVKLMNVADEIGKAGAKELERQLTANLQKKSGTPSNPGEYPAKQTGELVGSIERIRRRVGRKVEHEVRVTAPHASIVEKIRPFFNRTIREGRQQILAAMERAGKQRGLK